MIRRVTHHRLLTTCHTSSTDLFETRESVM
jgi:hypothetical protein